VATGDCKQQRALIAQLLCNILSMVLPLAENMDQLLAEDLEKTLLALINNHSFMNVRPVTDLVWVVWTISL
jgi:hypothetical protein